MVSAASIPFRFALYYLLGEMLIYLVYKIVRGDFQYWAPIGGLAGVVISLLMRVMTKNIADFTSCMHFRHPYEVGGLYFTLNLFLPLIGLTVMLPFGLLSKTFSEDVIELLTSLTGVLGTTLIVIVGLFIALIDKEYRHTFFSSETGAQMTRRNFLEGTDLMKADVFSNTEKHWYPIRAKVEAWVRAGWWTSEREKPEWFTDEWKLSVPEEMIPKKSARREGGEGEAKSSVEEETIVVAERRNSAIQLLAAGGLGVVRRKSVAAKVAPAGMNDGGVVDVEEFVREMERRGSINI